METYDIHNIPNDIFIKLLNELDVGIHVIDHSGKTIIYNKKMREIEAMAGEEVMAKDLLDVFSFEKSGSSTLVEALREGKTTKHLKQTYFNNKGKEITTINDSFPIHKDGEVIGAMEITKDVTRFEQVIKENVLQKQHTTFTFEKIIGESEPITQVIEEAKRATRTSSSVLIVGETGTGKELFAQSIHNGSSRAEGPFVSQNCAAIPDTLMESVLFGTKKGAFTGAVDRPGLFEQADGGTLLLDEINSLDPSLQAKLLRVLQERRVRRVGDTRDKKVDVRIMATTNEDPLDAISETRLRKDLYYRLSVVTLFIPPLRNRTDDLPLLLQHFFEKYNTLFHMDVKGITPEASAILRQHEWAGNVRELEHTIEGTMNLMVDEETVTPEHLPMRFRKKYNPPESQASDNTLEETVNSFEKRYIEQKLKENDGNISRTAKILGISRQSLQYRLKKHQLS